MSAESVLRSHVWEEEGVFQLRGLFSIIHLRSRARPWGVIFIEMLKALRRLFCGVGQVRRTPNGIIIAYQQELGWKIAALHHISILLSSVAVAGCGIRTSDSHN